MGDQQKDERIPKGSEVEELEEVLEEEEEGETLSMRFLALAVSHNTVPSSDRQRHSEVILNTFSSDIIAKQFMSEIFIIEQIFMSISSIS